MSHHSITSLIEKLEGAETGSLELDADVALQVGWTVHPGDNWIGPHAEIAVPDYTTSLDAALALAERIVGSKEALLLLSDMLTREADGSDFDAITVSDLPRLLCAAILRAKQ